MSEEPSKHGRRISGIMENNAYQHLGLWAESKIKLNGHGDNVFVIREVGQNEQGYYATVSNIEDPDSLVLVTDRSQILQKF